MDQWEPPAHSLSSVSFIILSLSYSFTRPAFFKSISPHSSLTLSKWGPSISQLCYYNPALAALHPKAPKVWMAQYNRRSRRKRWIEGDKSEERGEECRVARERDRGMDNLEPLSRSPPCFLWGWWGMRWCWTPVSQPDLLWWETEGFRCSVHCEENSQTEVDVKMFYILQFVSLRGWVLNCRQWMMKCGC